MYIYERDFVCIAGARSRVDNFDEVDWLFGVALDDDNESRVPYCRPYISRRLCRECIVHKEEGKGDTLYRGRSLRDMISRTLEPRRR